MAPNKYDFLLREFEPVLGRRLRRGGQKIEPPWRQPQQTPTCEIASNFEQRAGIAALGWLARLTNHPIQLGASGAFGAGAVAEGQFGISRQVVVGPCGQAALVTTLAFNVFPAGLAIGAGVLVALYFPNLMQRAPLPLAVNRSTPASRWLMRSRSAGIIPLAA